MEFFEMKSLAKKAGMELKSTTKKVDIEKWLAENEDKVAAIRVNEEAKVDVEVPEVGESFKVSKPVEKSKGCDHDFVFTGVQTFREEPRKDAMGMLVKGNLYFKDTYVCSRCSAIMYKDKSERPQLDAKGK